MNDDFHILQCNKSLYKKSVVNVSIKLHKSLPSETKKIDDFKKFKQVLRLFLLDNPFYSLSKFFTCGQ
jgi:hypothetical protein